MEKPIISKLLGQINKSNSSVSLEALWKAESGLISQMDPVNRRKNQVVSLKYPAVKCRLVRRTDIDLCPFDASS